MNIIRKARKDFGYTVQEAANLVHVSKEKWGELEKNNSEEGFAIVHLMCCLHEVPFSQYCQDAEILSKTENAIKKKKNEVISLIDERIKKEELSGDIQVILEEWEESKPLPDLQNFYEELGKRPKKRTAEHQRSMDKSISLAMDNLKRINEEMGGQLEQDIEEYIDEIVRHSKPYWILRLDIDFKKRSVSTKEICSQYNLSRAAVNNSMNKFFGELKHKGGRLHYWLLEDLRPLLQLMRGEI